MTKLIATGIKETNRFFLSWLVGRKIGVVPMWFANGKRVAATMLHIEDNHVIKYIPPEDFLKTMVGEKRSIPRIIFKEKVRFIFYM